MDEYYLFYSVKTIDRMEQRVSGFMKCDSFIHAQKEITKLKEDFDEEFYFKLIRGRVVEEK